jgi:MerR family Zn(II)-responsive transcriptional regulator of zntA
LTEIRELLALRENDAACCNDVRSVAIEKKLLLEHKIKALKDMSQALSELITICADDSRPLVDCPIIEALENSMVKHPKGKANG